MCQRRSSIAPHRIYSMTMPRCVWGEIQLRLIKLILRQLGNGLSHNWIASHLKYSERIANCTWAESQMHLIENTLRRIQTVSDPKLKCISSKIFDDNCKLRLSQISIACCPENSKTIPKCVLVEIQVHLIENIRWQLQTAS